MKKVRIAIAGFRHSHILELPKLAAQRDDVEIVAACEDHAPTAEAVRQGGVVKLTHPNLEDMLKADFDILAVGDYYARRGGIIIAGLEAGRHILADKPICTDLGELERITALAASKRLCVGCQLSLRDTGNFIALRQVIRSGRIGPVHTVTFTGQHPLLRQKRPGWYFEPGLHGGTINDIAIHGLDALGWLTGRRVATVAAARAWNARTKGAPHFQDAAQFMLTLDNGGGLLADVSYLAPDGCGYKVDSYWRFSVHGETGMAETSIAARGVTLWTSGGEQAEQVPPAPDVPGGYLDSLLDEMSGRSQEGQLTTAEVLESSRVTLVVQRAADQGRFDVPVN